MSDPISDIASQLVAAVAGQQGIALDTATAIQAAEQIAALAGELVAGSVKKKADADAEAAAGNIKTLDDAEAFEKRKP